MLCVLSDVDVCLSSGAIALPEVAGLVRSREGREFRVETLCDGLEVPRREDTTSRAYWLVEVEASSL